MTDSFIVTLTLPANKPVVSQGNISILTPTGRVESRTISAERVQQLNDTPEMAEDLVFEKIYQMYPGQKGRAHGSEVLYAGAQNNDNFYAGEVVVYRLDFDTVQLPPPRELDNFFVKVRSVVAGRDRESGRLPSGRASVRRMYRELPDDLREVARRHLDDRMKTCIMEADLPLAKAYLTLLDAVKGVSTESPKSPHQWGPWGPEGRPES